MAPQPFTLSPLSPAYYLSPVLCSSACSAAHLISLCGPSSLLELPWFVRALAVREIPLVASGSPLSSLSRLHLFLPVAPFPCLCLEFRFRFSCSFIFRPSALDLSFALLDVVSAFLFSSLSVCFVSVLPSLCFFPRKEEEKEKKRKKKEYCSLVVDQSSLYLWWYFLHCIASCLSSSFLLCHSPVPLLLILFCDALVSPPTSCLSSLPRLFSVVAF